MISLLTSLPMPSNMSIIRYISSFSFCFYHLVGHPNGRLQKLGWRRRTRIRMQNVWQRLRGNSGDWRWRQWVQRLASASDVQKEVQKDKVSEVSDLIAEEGESVEFRLRLQWYGWWLCSRHQIESTRRGMCKRATREYEQEALRQFGLQMIVTRKKPGKQEKREGPLTFAAGIIIGCVLRWPW